MKPDFKFELGDNVTLISGEAGTVIGRAEYDESNTYQYYIRYTTADGRLSENWWSEKAIA